MSFYFSDDNWRRVTLAVPGSLDLQEGGFYRYCLVLTRSTEEASDDINFAIGCSDLIQLYKNGEQVIIQIFVLLFNIIIY